MASCEQPPAPSKGGEMGEGGDGGAPWPPVSSPPLCPGEGRRGLGVCSCGSPPQHCRVLMDGYVLEPTGPGCAVSRAAAPFRAVRGQPPVERSYTVICIVTLQLSLRPGLGTILGKLQTMRPGEAWCAAVLGVQSRTRLGRNSAGARSLTSRACGRLLRPARLRALFSHQRPRPRPGRPPQALTRPLSPLPLPHPESECTPVPAAGLWFSLRTNRPRPH